MRRAGPRGGAGGRAPEPMSSVRGAGGRARGAGSLRRRRTGAGAGGRVRDAGARVWAGAGAGPAAGPAAETLGAQGSLTASEEEDSAQIV